MANIPILISYLLWEALKKSWLNYIFYVLDSLYTDASNNVMHSTAVDWEVAKGQFFDLFFIHVKTS